MLSSVCLSAQQNRQGRRYLTERYNGKEIEREHLDPSYRYDVARLARTMDGPDFWEPITVPVVFHVLYQADSDRLSEELLLAQLDQLNQDFAGETTSNTAEERDVDGRFAAIKADTKINFCVPAPGSLNDDYTTPFIYHQIDSVFNNGLNRIKRAELGSEAVSSRRCLNIWITPLKNNIAGFAQFPGGRAGKDGIVIDPAYILGSPTVIRKYNQGKTLTHLVGNYLGLRPLWTNRDCLDDGIADTPVHNLPNRGRSAAGHVSLCDGNPLEMTMNFMDSGRDSELSMFTEGQARWMRAVLDREGPRGRLPRVEVECDYLPAPALAGKSLITKTDVTNMAGPPKVFPNPASNRARVVLPGAERSVKELIVLDIKGSIVYRLPAGKTASTIELDLTSWPNGIYFIKLLATDGQTYTNKITVL